MDLMATEVQQTTDDELTRLRADAARLDALDRANAALNQQYGTTYRWRCDANHNRVSLTDMHASGYPTVREAIDAWRAGKR